MAIPATGPASGSGAIDAAPAELELIILNNDSEYEVDWDGFISEDEVDWDALATEDDDDDKSVGSGSSVRVWWWLWNCYYPWRKGDRRMDYSDFVLPVEIGPIM